MPVRRSPPPATDPTPGAHALREGTVRLPSPSLRGLLTALGPLAVLLALVTDAPSTFAGGRNVLTPLGAAWFGLGGAMLSASGLLLSRWPARGRWLARAGLLVVGGGILPAVVEDPAIGLAVLLGIGGLFFQDLGRLPAESGGAGASPTGAAWSSGWVALVAWLLVGAEQIVTSPLAYGLVALGFAIGAVHAGAWFVASGLHRSTRHLLSAAACPALWLLALAFLPSPGVSLLLLALAQAWILVRLLAAEPSALERLANFMANPARQMVVTFALLGIVGGVLLSLPAAAARSPIHLLDGVFTAVSASCVTGLTVKDTALDFTPFGHVVILLLIQVGGLGIMTFSAAASLALGQRLSLRTEAALSSLLTEGRSTLRSTLSRVMALTFALEAAGAVLLTLLFVRRGEPLSQAVWQGVFTSISAFCNAGFALQSDNLVPYQQDPLLLHTVAALVIAGGLGYSVMAALPLLVLHRGGLLQARVVLVTTATLLVVGTLLMAGLEWNNTLGHMGVWDRVHNAWFAAVTPRTAGFNSIDYTRILPVTSVVTMLLMFIGGSPGSTAGGIKTTTAALLFLAVTSTLRGRPEIALFGKRVDHASVYKATAVTAMGMAVAVSAYAGLLLTQRLDPQVLAFEVLSALGTVGLTMGATVKLDAIGKLIIIVCMFLGRVGPLSLLLLMDAPARRGAWQLPEESISVG